jgi:hypothetical protein
MKLWTGFIWRGIWPNNGFMWNGNEAFNSWKYRRTIGYPFLKRNCALWNRLLNELYNWDVVHNFIAKFLMMYTVDIPISGYEIRSLTNHERRRCICRICGQAHFISSAAEVSCAELVLSCCETFHSHAFIYITTPLALFVARIIIIIIILLLLLHQ